MELISLKYSTLITHTEIQETPFGALFRYVHGVEDAAPTRALSADLAAAATALDVISDYESRWPLIMYLEAEKAPPNAAGRKIYLTLPRSRQNRDKPLDRCYVSTL